MLLFAASLFLFPHYTLVRDQYAHLLTTDSMGSAYVVSEIISYSVSKGSFLTKVDLDGRVVYRLPIDFDPFLESIHAIADSRGYLYLSIAQYPCCNGHSNAIKIDPVGTVVYQMFLPVLAATPAPGPDGSAYFAGSCVPSPGVTTAGAWVSDSAAAPGQENAIVIKVDPAGDIVYSTFLDNAPLVKYPHGGTRATSIAVDSAGSAYVFGYTDDPGFPLTPEAMQTVCACTHDDSFFVLKLSPDGSKLMYSTYFGDAGGDAVGGDLLKGEMILDAAGNAEVVTRPTPTFWVEANPPAATVRVRKFGLSGTYLISDRSLTLPTPEFDARLDGQGNLILAGSGDAINLPLSEGAFRDGKSSIVIVRTSDLAVQYSTRVPDSVPFVGVPSWTVEAATDHDGGLIVLRDLGLPPEGEASNAWSLVRLVPSASSRPAILGIANAAEPVLSSGIARGEMLDISGTNLGPSVKLAASFDSTGHLPFTLGGTQVFIGGVAAALLSVSAEHVLAIVPNRAATDTLTIEVRTKGESSNSVELPRVAAEPQIVAAPVQDYYNYPFAAALNQDGTVNSAENPAGGGEVMTVFINGGGGVTPTPEEGTAGKSDQKLVLPVSALAHRDGHSGVNPFYSPAEVLYAGAAPGLAGLTQINVRLPPAQPSYIPASLVLTIGDQSTTAAFWVGR